LIQPHPDTPIGSNPAAAMKDPVGNSSTALREIFREFSLSAKPLLRGSGSMTSEMSLPMVTAAESLRSNLRSEASGLGEVTRASSVVVGIRVTQAPTTISVTPWVPLNVANLDGGHNLSCCEVVESEVAYLCDGSEGFCPGSGEVVLHNTTVILLI